MQLRRRRQQRQGSVGSKYWKHNTARVRQDVPCKISLRVMSFGCWSSNRTPKAGIIVKPFATRSRSQVAAPHRRRFIFCSRAASVHAGIGSMQSSIWHYYAGAPLALEMLAGPVDAVERITVGCDLCAGARPQVVVPARCWQSAQSLGDWTFVGCTVAPGFEFAGFELAPDDWRPSSTI